MDNRLRTVQPPQVTRPRFTARIVILEQPEVAERVAQAAEIAGHSVAAEIRGAIRYWLEAKTRR